MPIDPSQVQWDAPAPTAAKGIDPSSVQWDDEPAPIHVVPNSIGDALKPQSITLGDDVPTVTHLPVDAVSGALTGSLANAAKVIPMAAGGLTERLGLPNSVQDIPFSAVKSLSEYGNAQQDAAQKISPVGAMAGNVLSILPQLAGGEAAVGGKGAELLTSNAPKLLKALYNMRAAVPLAGTLGTEAANQQATNVIDKGGDVGTAEKLYGTSLAANTLANLIPAGATGSPIIRSLAGGAANAAGGTAAQEAEHMTAPTFVPAPTIESATQQGGIGALLSLVLGHSGNRPDALPEVTGATMPVGQPALPAPEAAPAAKASPAPPPVTDLPTAAGAFIADPKAALSALDPVVLHQVAGDAGITVKPGTATADIIDTLIAKGTPTLHSDVLPAYMDALQEHGLPSAPSIPDAGAPPAPEPASPAPQDFAQALQAGATVPVDSRGTAYTPQQGMSEMAQAMGSKPTPPALPAPVTTVDSQGNASNSATFLAKTKAAQDEAAQLQNAVLHRQSLGITPDIERTQSPRWQAQEAASHEIANQQAVHDDGDMATQRTDDSPPWWLAGQQADEEATAARASVNAQKLQTAIQRPGPANAPMHPWTPIDSNVDVPYAGGQSKDLSKAFIDRRIPQTMPIDGKTIDVHEAIGLHENIESSLIHNTKTWSPAELDALAKRVGLQSGKDFPALVREKLQAGKALSYVQGHNIATKGENHLVATKYGVPAAKYQMGLQSSIKAALKQGTGADNIPHDLDTKPYDNMGESHLVPQQDDAYQQHLTDLAGERQAMSGDDRARAAKVLSDAGVPLADHDEALAMIQLADRAYSAGAEPRDILTDPHMTPSAKARALYDLAEKQENPRADTENGPSRPQADDGSSTQGLSRTGAANDQADREIAPAEQDRRVPAEAHQIKGDLFAPATVKDRIRAANEAKDDARNGLTGGRTDTGDGGLFDGKRPEQVSLDSVESDQTNTPAFRKWFGDSKVVDANGKPLVVYHGTGESFDEFRQGAGKGAGGYSSRLGYFFTDSPKVATSYADESVEFQRTRGYEKQMQLERRGRYDEAQALGEHLESPDFHGGMAPNVVPAYLSIKNPKVVDFNGRSYDAERDNLSELINDAKADGHDGVIFRNLDDAPRAGFQPADHYVAFRPDQIKSSTGNRGTFDATKPGILDQAEVTHHSLDDNTPEAHTAKQAIERDRQSKEGRESDERMMEYMRQESRDQGERDATQLGLRDVVSKTLGGLGGNLKVEFLRDETGMPAGSNLRRLPKGGRRLGTFNPQTKRVFLFTGSNPSLENVAFTAAHEVYGHRAMRMLADAHPEVKVGSLTAPEALNKALDMAMQNPTVAKIAESMGKQRGTDDVRLMAEEALADLAAAKQTGNWEKIKTKHGVDVPEGVRNGVKGAIANFIERMKRILNAIIAKVTGKPADFTDAQVHEFMQDSANALHEGEAREGAGEAMDQVDHEAVKSDGLSLTKVKSLLVERGIPEETANAMSRDQLRAEQAQLRARSEPTPQIKDTGVKNATKEEERAMKGKAEVEHDLSTTNPAQYATAKARFDADPHAGQLLAAKVISDKKAITPEDSILLGLDAMRIINARQVAYEQAEKAMASGDHATRVAALSLVRQLDGQMEANDIASRYAGVRAGQALQARKVMIAQDYSMARMVLRAKVAKGADLTDAERTKVEKASADIAQRTKALDEREAKLRAMEAEARPVAQKRAAKAKFDDLAAQLKAIAQKDHMKPGCVA